VTHHLKFKHPKCVPYISTPHWIWVPRFGQTGFFFGKCAHPRLRSEAHETPKPPPSPEEQKIAGNKQWCPGRIMGYHR
jgi:hypothetical protein